MGVRVQVSKPGVCQTGASFRATEAVFEDPNYTTRQNACVLYSVGLKLGTRLAFQFSCLASAPVSSSAIRKPKKSRISLYERWMRRAIVRSARMAAASFFESADAAMMHTSTRRPTCTTGITSAKQSSSGPCSRCLLRNMQCRLTVSIHAAVLVNWE